MELSPCSYGDLKAIEKLISFLKKDSTYRLDPHHSLRSLFYIVYYRGWQVLRGVWIRLKLGSSQGVIFCGRSVIIEHGYQISAQTGLILEDGVKINALSAKGLILGRNVTIGKDAILVCTGVIASQGVGIWVGNNTGIGAQSFLGGQGGIQIGNDVIIGPGVKVFSENHNFHLPDLPIRKQGENRKGVVIEDNCWIGAGAIILDGTHIESGVVVAAGSIVTRSIPANSVVAGVPAKVIKSRIKF